MAHIVGLGDRLDHYTSCLKLRHSTKAIGAEPVRSVTPEQPIAADLNSLTVFLAVADTRNYRIAAERLGVTRSAISQSLRKLEDTLGIALVRRTRRSARLTEVGETLQARVSPPFADVEAALAQAIDRDTAPSVQLRLALSSIAERFMAGPLFAGCADAHPGVQLDVTVTDNELDVVAAVYDASVRLGELVKRDVIAVPASCDRRQPVVASPAHLVRYGTPPHPRELVNHCCIDWRPPPEVAAYRWYFEENDAGSTSSSIRRSLPTR